MTTPKATPFNQQLFGKPTKSGIPCRFSWWCWFETPPEVFYETAKTRADEMQQTKTDTRVDRL